MKRLPANHSAKARAEALGHRPGHAHPYKTRGKGWRQRLEWYRALQRRRLGYHSYVVARPQKKRDGRKPRDKK